MTTKKTFEKLFEEALTRELSDVTRITTAILALALAVRENTEAVRKQKTEEKEILNSKGENYATWCKNQPQYDDYS